MSEVHIHRDVIIAWANGKDIEGKIMGKWISITDPLWYPDREYRVDPPVKSEADALKGTVKDLEEEIAKLKRGMEQLEVARSLVSGISPYSSFLKNSTILPRITGRYHE